MDAPQYTFSFDWFALNVPVWQDQLAELANQPFLTALEVGCFEGRSTIWLLDNILTDPTSRIFCVDSFQGGFEHQAAGIDMVEVERRFDSNILASGSRERVVKIRGQSAECLRRLGWDQFDFIYLDGSHLAWDVLEDGVLAFRLLKQGGLMAFDDYLWDQLVGDSRHPKVGIDAFLFAYRNLIQVEHSGYQIFVRKR